MSDHVESVREEFPLTASELHDNIIVLYVDDVLTQENSVTEAAHLALDINIVLASGRFPRRTFVSKRKAALCTVDNSSLSQ